MSYRKKEKWLLVKRMVDYLIIFATMLSLMYKNIAVKMAKEAKKESVQDGDTQVRTRSLQEKTNKRDWNLSLKSMKNKK